MLAGDPSPVLLEWLLNLWLVPVPGPASVMASSTRACDELLPRTGRTIGVLRSRRLRGGKQAA
jgi:hypothetical protein